MTSTALDRARAANPTKAIKAPCRAATTANITLSGEQTIDGVAVVTDDRVLVKNQTTGSQNGIYLVDTGAWQRAPDFDDNRDVVTGGFTFVTNGTANASTYWRVTTANPITIDTTSITFGQITPFSVLALDSLSIGWSGPNAAGQRLNVSGNVTGAVDVRDVLVNPEIQSGVTTRYVSFNSFPSTDAAAFTLPDLVHFMAEQGTKGAGSSITNQYGFAAADSLTGATNNYGFHGNIAAATGRYNFYAAGTAENFFAGKTSVGTGDALALDHVSTAQAFAVRKGTAASPDTTSDPLVKVERLVNVAAGSISGDGSQEMGAIMAICQGTTANEAQPIGLYGAAISNFDGGSGSGDACGIYGVGRFNGAGVGSGIGGFFAGHRTTATGRATGIEIVTNNSGGVATTYNSTGYSDGIGIWLNAMGNADSGVGISISNGFGYQFEVGIGFTAQVTGAKTGGVSGQSIRDDSQAATSIQINGTHTTAAIAIADTAGSVNIGAITAPTAGRRVVIQGGATGAVDARGLTLTQTIQSGVTTQYIGVSSVPSTAAAAFTCASLVHFLVEQGTIGAGSAVTTQYGFAVANSMTGAGTNYGFHGNIAAGANRFNFYAAGTAANFFQGATGIAGGLKIGADASITGSRLLEITGNITGAVTTRTAIVNGEIQSGVTTLHVSFTSAPTTAAAAFTLTELDHFRVDMGAIGAGSAVTTQVGFLVPSTMTGATNNYAFIANLAAAANRWNFYAGGTAANYFAGNVGIGETSLSERRLGISGDITGATTAYGVVLSPTVLSGVTTLAVGMTTVINTTASAFTCASLVHYRALQGTIGAGSAVTSQYGFQVDSSLTGATNNFGFHSNIAAAGNRWNFYAAGTARNFFAGKTSIGNATEVGSQYMAELINTGSGNVAALVKNDDQPTATLTVLNASTAGDAVFVTFGTEATFTLRGGIDYNRAGNATRYNTTSDQRLKRDLGVASDIRVLRDTVVHDFEWKETKHRGIGVFAQEAYEVFPDAISKGDDDDEVSRPWGASYASYVPHLLVGWKNHEARIAALEQRQH